jgi:hypothetical protein
LLPGSATQFASRSASGLRNLIPPQLNLLPSSAMTKPHSSDVAEMAAKLQASWAIPLVPNGSEGQVARIGVGFAFGVFTNITRLRASKKTDGGDETLGSSLTTIGMTCPRHCRSYLNAVSTSNWSLKKRSSPFNEFVNQVQNHSWDFSVQIQEWMARCQQSSRHYCLMHRTSLN